MAKFLRIETHKYSRLGSKRKKKRVYRRPKGGENKIRLNRAGRLRKVKIGFKRKKSGRGLINGMKPVIVYNKNDLEKIKNNMIGIVGKIGDKKRKEIAEYALEKKLRLLNLDPKTFLERFAIKNDDKKQLVNQKLKEIENKTN